VYRLKDLAELVGKLSNTVVAKSLSLVRRSQEVKALDVEVVELVHSLKHLLRDAVAHRSPLKRLVQFAE